MGSQLPGTAGASGAGVTTKTGLGRRLSSLDWSLIKGSAWLSGGMVWARLLGFAFSLVLAGVFTPEVYGFVQYTIAVAMVVSIATQPFGQHVIARFIGKYREDEQQLQRTLSAAWVILAVLFVLTLLVAGPVLALTGKFVAGVLVIFFGNTLFYVYWGLARGFIAPRRLTTAYLGSNVVQLALVLMLIVGMGMASPALAIYVYGLSYLLPLALLQIFWPIPTFMDLSQVRRVEMAQLLRFSRPIWISHACFMLFNAISLLLLERFHDTAAVGVYSVAKTLATVLLFIPIGMSTLLVPQAAALDSPARTQLLKRSLVITLATNAAILVGYIVLAQPFVRVVLGQDYVVPVNVTIVLGLAMTVVGVNSIITAVVVGAGEPAVETASRVVTLMVAALVGWLLIPVASIQGAACAELAGALSGLITFAIILVRRWR